MHEVAKYCSSDQRDWDVKLPTWLIAYRSSGHEATIHTLARLMFGRELQLSVDLSMGCPLQKSMVPIASSYVQALRERLDGAHRHARDNMWVARCAMKTRYDWRSREAKLDVDDQVWLYNPLRRKGLSPKLQSPWDRPYNVLEILSDVTYRIHRGGQRRPLVIHVDRLWVYHGPGSFSWNDRGVEDDDDKGVEDEMEVQTQPGETKEGVEDQQEDTWSHDNLSQAALSVTGPERGRSQRARPQSVWFKDYEVKGEG